MAFVLTRPISSGSGVGTGVTGMTITNINGQPILTLEDTTRGNKILSVAENPVSFAENVLDHNNWLQIGNAGDADSAFVADFNGTIVASTGHCENVNNNDKNINLYINSADQGAIGSFTGATADTFINTTLNIDFNQGDTIRLRAKDGTPGLIQDSVIKLTIKWRG
jgi:hypothetical protein